jgi:hypothetical protein
MPLRPERATLRADHAVLAAASDLVMRFSIVLLTALTLTAPALAQSRAACEMASAELLASVLGSYELRETQDPAPGISLCSWRGEEGKYITIHSVTAEGDGINKEDALEGFEIATAVRKEQMPSYVHDLEGPWQAAYIVEDSNEETNPDRAFSISFINKGDTVTVQTAFIERETAIALAEEVAGGM